MKLESLLDSGLQAENTTLSEENEGMTGIIQRLEFQNSDLAARLNKAEEDSNRLDWWIENRSCNIYIFGGLGCEIRDSDGRLISKGQTPREAIDKAISLAPPGVVAEVPGEKSSDL